MVSLSDLAIERGRELKMVRHMRDDIYRPAGRLVPIFAASEGLAQDQLALSLSQLAASRGETVLMLDTQDGALMKRAGIIYNKTLGDVIYRGADISDSRHVPAGTHRLMPCLVLWRRCLYPMIGSLLP